MHWPYIDLSVRKEEDMNIVQIFAELYYVIHLWPYLLNWIYFNPSMYK